MCRALSEYAIPKIIRLSRLLLAADANFGCMIVELPADSAVDVDLGAWTEHAEMSEMRTE